VKRKGRSGTGDLIAVIRRAEIERFARAIGVADTDDFDRFLIAWHWHNARSKDCVGALMEAVRRMGGIITKEFTEQLIQEAGTKRQIRKPDPLGKYLGLTDGWRTALDIRTIGAVDISSKERARRTKERNRIHKQNKRRERGAKPRSEYEANSILRAKPWEKEGISRATWYHRQKQNQSAGQVRQSSCLPLHNWTSPGVIYCLRITDTPVQPERKNSRQGHRVEGEGKTLKQCLERGSNALGAQSMLTRNLSRGREPALLSDSGTGG
jgi:hypothetical protein